jgi:enamine deaminase RidA (YjgF/YER057c/UK114 family)
MNSIKGAKTSIASMKPSSDDRFRSTETRVVAALERQIINPWSWQDQFGFVQANAVTSAERTIYCSGQTSMDADGNPVHEGDMRAQLSQALDNLEAVLRESDCELSNVVRLNYYTTDVDGFLAALDVVVTRLDQAGCRPATTLLGVSRLALPPLLVEVEATAITRAGG